jgi:glycosyltransferase involved in cell wall biosynthesis
MMHILYVTNGFPYPLTSGYLRHYHLLRQLAREHRSTLLSLASARHRAEDREALADFTEHVEVFIEPGSRGTRRIAQRASAAMLGDARRPHIRALVAAARHLHAQDPFDAIVLSGKTTAPVLDALPGIPVVADLCDATSTRLDLEARYASPSRRVVLRARARTVRAAERRLARGARHLLFASVRDRELVLGPTPGPGVAPSSIVPNGVDLEYWQRTQPVLGRGRIVFSGAMHYGPNVDAAIQLVRQILPRVQVSVPDAELVLVGRDPDPRLIAAARDRRGVIVTGAVPDMRPWLETAAVFAAPLRIAAGIQNKLLEALAMEVPAVTSTLAADGLRTDTDRAPVTLADSTEDAVTALVDALGRSAADPAPHAAGRAYVAQHFDWERSGTRLSAILQEVAAGTSAGHVRGAG